MFAQPQVWKKWQALNSTYCEFAKSDILKNMVCDEGRFKKAVFLKLTFLQNHNFPKHAFVEKQFSPDLPVERLFISLQNNIPKESAILCGGIPPKHNGQE